MSIDTVWQEALHYIQGKVTKQVYDTWFTPVHLDRIENSTAHISVPNKFFGEWLDTHYGSPLAVAMATARGGGLMFLHWAVNGGKDAERSRECRHRDLHGSQAQRG